MWQVSTDSLIDVGNGMVRVSEIAAATVPNGTSVMVTLTLKSGVQVGTWITLAEFRERMQQAFGQ